MAPIRSYLGVKAVLDSTKTKKIPEVGVQLSEKDLAQKRGDATREYQLLVKKK